MAEQSCHVDSQRTGTKIGPCHSTGMLGALLRFLQRRQILDDIDQLLGLELLLQVGGHQREGRFLQLFDVVTFQLVDDGLSGFQLDGIVGLADENAAEGSSIQRADEPGFIAEADAGAGIENGEIQRFLGELTADF
jgi:hypothetical protein